MTEQDSTEKLLAELFVIVEGNDRACEIVSELRDRLGEEDWVLPIEVLAALKGRFPMAGKKTIEAVERRCKFAHRVWADKYGPLTLDQGRYAIELMVWVIGQSKGSYPFLYAGFDRIINHENVDAGFKKRAGDVETITFDAMELLQ